MSLTYQNIFDHEAEQFVDHYDEVFGTLNPFSIASAGTSNGGKAGWNGVATAGSFSSQGYQVRVSPGSLVEGDTFDVFFDGPASAAAAGLHYWEVTGVQADDFERLIADTNLFLGAYHNPYELKAFLRNQCGVHHLLRIDHLQSNPRYPLKLQAV